MKKKPKDIIFELEAANFEEGKTYWVLVGDENHEPSPPQMRRVIDQLKKDFPEMKWIVTPYYIKPVSKRIKKKKRQRK